MTTIALIILIVLAAIVLLMITGLILWQRKANSRLNRVQEHIAQHIENIEKLLEELKQDHERSKEWISKELQKEIVEIKETPVCDLASDPQAACLSGKEESETLQIEKDEIVDTDDVLEQMEQFELPLDTDQYQTKDADRKRGSQTLETPMYNIGKSGKVYTEEELELLIKE